MFADFSELIHQDLIRKLDTVFETTMELERHVQIPEGKRTECGVSRIV